MEMDINSHLIDANLIKELAQIIFDIEQQPIKDISFEFTLSDIKKFIDIINLRGTYELKSKLVEFNLYLKLENFLLIINEEKIIKKLKTSEYELTLDQSLMLELFGKFLISSINIFGLYGYAGTGKTTMIIQIVINLIKAKIFKKIAIVAPTNKAVSVLKNKFNPNIHKIFNKFNFPIFHSSLDLNLEYLRSKNIILDFITIHNLLQLKIDYDDLGELVYVNNKNTLINDYDLIIIDEASMVTTSMIDHILNQTKTKLVFAGDPAQLPPINEKICAIFLKDYEDFTFHRFKDIINRDRNKNLDVYTKTVMDQQLKMRYDNFIENLKNIETYTLTQVMRTKNKNIIKTCMLIRYWIEDRCELPAFEKCNGRKGVKFYNYQGLNKFDEEWFKLILNDIKNVNQNSIILTWTNSQANEYNQMIRNEIYGKKKLKRFEIGDALVLNDYYNFKSQINKISTSELMKVDSIKIIKYKPILFADVIDTINFDKLKNPVSLKKKIETFITTNRKIFEIEYVVYELLVHNLSDNEKIQLKILVLDTDYELKHSGIVKELQNLIKKFLTKLTTNGYSNLQIDLISRPLWKNLHEHLIEPFASVSYGYAITCHKAQGSNFYNVYIDCNDIMKNTKENEMKRCLYTAFTRTMNKLAILI